MQLGEGAGGANNLAIGGENLHEDLNPSWLRVLLQYVSCSLNSLKRGC